MKQSKTMVIWLLLMFCMKSVFALSILEKLDQTTELNKLSDDQRTEGRHQLILMLTRCEFAESCLLQMINDLTIIEQKTHNPMYQVYLNYLQAKKPEFTEQMSRCDIPEKKAARKIIANCLYEMVIKESAMKIIDRNTTDRLEDERDQCLKEKMEEAAKKGNLFAQAMMVNLFEQNRNTEQFNHWYNEMQKKANTKAYNDYLACPDIP